jgi:phosphatidate cytidylyltransferase
VNTTVVRVASAVIAVLVFAGIFSLWGVTGLVYAGCLTALLVSIEFSRMIYKESRYGKTFVVISALISISIITNIENTMLVFISMTLLMFASMLGKVRKGMSVQEVLALQGLTSLGLIYCGVLPGYVVKMLNLDQGLIWFVMLLAINFAGDTAAYFVGRKWGRRKLLEEVSPKKTVEGSWAGLIGSTVIGALFANGFDLDYRFAVPVAFMTGALGQIGDLFESTIKRVADVKDSGGIMPGHGGMMDRLDAVYFSAPFFYFMASRYSLFVSLWTPG